MTATDTAATLRALAIELNRAADALEAARQGGKAADQLGAVTALTDALYTSILPRLADVESWAKEVAPKLQRAAEPARTEEKAAPTPAPEVKAPTAPAPKAPAKPKPKRTAKPKPATSAARTTKPDGAVLPKAPTRDTTLKSGAKSATATPKPATTPAKPAAPDRKQLVAQCRAINGLLHGAQGFTPVKLNAPTEKLSACVTKWAATAAEQARKLADLLSPVA